MKLSLKEKFEENPFLVDLVKLEARDMLQELKSNRLKVVLLPAPDPQFEGHSIRQSIEWNVDWYRTIFERDESIKRQHSITALKRISKGDILYQSKYHNLFLEIILNRIGELDG